jgi:hypothetical protein
MKIAVASATAPGNPDYSPRTPVTAPPALVCPGAPLATSAWALPPTMYPFGVLTTAELATQPVQPFVAATAVPTGEAANGSASTTMLSVSLFGPMPLIGICGACAGAPLCAQRFWWCTG